MKKHKSTTKQNYEQKSSLLTKSDESLMGWGVILILIGTPLIVDSRLASIELGKAIWIWVFTCGCLLIWSIKMSMSSKIMVLKTPLNIPLLAFLFSCILSTCFSLLPCLSLVGDYKRHEGLLTIVSYVVLCCICTNFIRDIAWVKKGATILVCVGVIAAVCGILQPFGIDISRWGSDGVPISFFGNQNYTGGYMAMVVFFGIGLLLNSNTKKHIILAGISSLLMYSCLIITKNRGGFLGLLIGLLIFTILNRTEIWKKRKIVAISGLILLLTTAGLCLYEKTSPLPKLIGTIRVVQSEGKKRVEAAGSFASRIQIWKTILRVIVNNPLLGVGPDALRMASTKYEILEFIQSEGTYDMLIDRAHNEMLDIAAMRGLIGLAVYLWLLSVFFIVIMRLWKRMIYPDKWLISAGIAAIISYVVQNTVGFGVISTSSLFWILIGSIVGIGAKPMGYVSHTVNINRLVRISLLISSILLCVIIIRYSLLACIADVYYKNGLGLAQHQDIDQAIYMYEKALEYNPIEESYYAEMLTAYSNKSNGSREALSMLIKRAEDAVRVNPYHAYYYNILSSAYGKSYTLYGDASVRNKAIDACNRAIELKPVFGDPHNNLTAIYVHEKKYKEAINEIKKAIKICPEHAEYWRILGELQIQQGLKRTGLSSLEKAIKYNPTMVNILVSLSRIYFEAGDLLKAEERMKQAVLLVPDNSRYHRVLGSIYFKQGRLDKATSEFTTALRLSPNDSYLKQMLASCQQR